MKYIKCVVTLTVLFQMSRIAYSHEEPTNDLTDSDEEMEIEPVRKNSDDNGLSLDLSPTAMEGDVNPEIRILAAATTETTTYITLPEAEVTTQDQNSDLYTQDPTTTMEAPIASYSPPATGPPMSRRYRRIYNPDETASVTDFPFIAALLMNGELWCGAAIISQDAVLTAAHCLQLQFNNRFYREYVKMLTVRVGSSNATSGGEVYRVSELFFHPNYKPNTLEFNFAVIKLHKNMTMGTDVHVGTIKYSKDHIVPTNTQIAFLGWGSVLGSGDIGGRTLLQRVTLPVYDLADCQEIYGRDIVTRTNFCAGYITLPKNVCNHDAGGPAILDGVLVGILSFSSKRCDQPDQPAVFSKVSVVADWLNHLWEKKPELRLLLRTDDSMLSGAM